MTEKYVLIRVKPLQWST